MNRRDLLGQLGALGAGLAAVGPLAADDTTKPAKHVATGPMGIPHAHFCGIHLAKNNPKFQIVTQHYCVAAGDGLHQCLLYDSTGANAKLIGVEYIVTDAIYRALPDDEKKYWHPHTYEVLAGGLIAPGMNEKQENEFMSYILTTWGKTWHTWPDPTTKVPMGEPLLIWSLIGDGQVDDRVVAARDKEFGCDTAKVRQKRLEHFKLDVPNVSLPKAMTDVGRQWTDRGEDKPTKRK